jgi:putative ABC transport system permease protein
MLFLNLFRESILFAFTALRVNRLRTILSLLGVTIGILAIISVFTAVDSFEKKFRDSMASLGDNVVFVHKWPWSFGSDYPWWKYINRPLPSPEELNYLQRRLKFAEAAAFEVNTKSSVQYEKVTGFELSEGRYFAESESETGRDVVVLGSNVAEVLFPAGNATGREVKIFGRKVLVIGVMKKQGESSLGPSTDTEVLLPVNFARNFIDTRKEGANPSIRVKAAPGISNEQLKDELTGLMRGVRKLKPVSDDNFALNETSMISNQFDQVAGVIEFAGWIIGGFAILVGGFGISNIMFVSVRERTNQIGIQKSLGAKNYFILMQFLSESVILSLLGGLIGLGLVYVLMLVVNAALDQSFALTIPNIVLSITISVLIGIISGFIPAYSASQLDPVEAIRMN